MSQAAGKLDIQNLKGSLRKSEVAEEGEKITKNCGVVCLAEKERQ